MASEFKILSIDGGGIKGLYSATVLKTLEESYECSISDHFDMICGTSAGGIIALGLASGRSAQEIADLFYEKGAEIFPPYVSFIKNKYRSFRQIFYKGKFSSDALVRTLKDFFGEKSLEEANNLLIIPSFNLTKGITRTFKFPHNEGRFTKDRKIKMYDAALATSAAPTYLPIHEVEGALYIDGGVWANNPVICGLLESLEYFVGEGKQFQTYSILSISSISQPTGWNVNEAKNRPFIEWKNRLFQTSMDGQAFFSDFFMGKIINFTNPIGKYYRIPSPKLSAKQINEIDIDKATPEALKLMRYLGEFDGHDNFHRPFIEPFFKDRKLYNP